MKNANWIVKAIEQDVCDEDGFCNSEASSAIHSGAEELLNLDVPPETVKSVLQDAFCAGRNEMGC